MKIPHTFKYTFVQTALIMFQSAGAVQFLKKDLQEFTNVMKEDTTKAAEDVKKQLTVSHNILFCTQL